MTFVVFLWHGTLDNFKRTEKRQDKWTGQRKRYAGIGIGEVQATGWMTINP